MRRSRARARIEAAGVALFCGAVVVAAAQLVLETFEVPRAARLALGGALAAGLLLLCWHPSRRGPA